MSMEVIYNLPGEVSVENGGMVYNQGNSHDFWLSKIPLTPFTRGKMTPP
jgi:hypothetical protein